VFAWNLVEAVHTFHFIAEHLAWLTTPWGNLSLIVFGFVWLSLILFWGGDRPHEELSNQIQKQQDEAEMRTDDPHLEICFISDANVPPSTDRPFFELVNRGSSIAKNACIERISLQEHAIDFPNKSNIPPREHVNVYQNVESPGVHPPTGSITEALWMEFENCNNAKLHEFVVPIKVTYQDDVRNLFETRAELVLNPTAYRMAQQSRVFGRGIVDIRNQKAKKVASALRVQWA
jgi:hypothetical protein